MDGTEPAGAIVPFLPSSLPPDQLQILRKEIEESYSQLMRDMNENARVVSHQLDGLRESVNVNTNSIVQLGTIVQTVSNQVNWVTQTVDRFVREDAPKMAKSMFKGAMNPFGRKGDRNGDETSGD